MNKKGFTLIELLATIVVIGIIGGIAVVSYNAFIKSSTDQAFESYEKTMYSEVAYYLSNHTNEIPSNNSSTTFTMTKMLNDVKMEEFKNPDNPNDKCMNSYVKAERNDVGNVLSLTYKVCLKCDRYNNDESKCKTFPLN